MKNLYPFSVVISTQTPGMHPNYILEGLRQNGFLDEKNTPSHKAITEGYLVPTDQAADNDDIFFLVTEKGYDYILELFIIMVNEDLNDNQPWKNK